MIGTIGEILISASFFTSLIALVLYYFAAQRDEDPTFLKRGNWTSILSGVCMLVASGLLVDRIFAHDFGYYYVFNYTSADLEPKYLWSSFYAGQEGSFMIWILFSWILSFGLMKWTRKPYKVPVLFFLAFTQVFLISMVLGWDVFGLKLGSNPFRTFAEEFPNIPIVQGNPDFAPENGKGLNDLLKSPWMVIHPPLLFLSFALMTVPFCFALASLWKRKYDEWVGPALPWTLGANVALLTAIFLGGYWAYVTLSFGGFWAWDPVENASLVPWLMGTAGIHTMIIQRKSSVAQKSSILFAILAYMMIVYETFLTKSGVLGSSSVHSFVDLGLYNQLLIFMLVITIVGLGMFAYRYKELPSPKKESKVLSREFMTFTGAMMLFILGLVIILGTSSPIIGLLFSERPTPPEISFYNDWSMPIAIVMALLTVVGQYLFWKKYDLESLASALINPLLITSAITMAAIFFGGVKNLYYMFFFFAGVFAVVGNTFVMVRLFKKNPKLIGGTITHVGFGLLLIGSLASSVFNTPMVDAQVAAYNASILRGEQKDEQGFTIKEQINFLQLNLGQPKTVADKYIVTYEGYEIVNQNRPGQQTYKIRFEPIGGGAPFYLFPEVYPMLTSSTAESISWGVDTDVHTGFLSDIYLYAAGSAYVEKQNDLLRNRNQLVQPVSDTLDVVGQDEIPVQRLTLGAGQSVEMGSFKFRLVRYANVDSTLLPEGVNIGIKAEIEVSNLASGTFETIEPTFAVNVSEGLVYSPPVSIPAYGLDVQFTRISVQEERIELTVVGLEKEDDWVLLVADQKPLISVVWLGTFLLMIGFSFSIMRHWEREKNKNQDK